MKRLLRKANEEKIINKELFDACIPECYEWSIKTSKEEEGRKSVCVLKLNEESYMGGVDIVIADMKDEPTNKITNEEIILCSFDNQVVGEKEQEEMQINMDEGLIAEKREEALNRLKESGIHFIWE